MQLVTSRESERSKDSFDAVADSYDLYRPAPPRGVVDAVIALSNLHTGSRGLEIGCGAGQSSVPLAEYGVDLWPSSWAGASRPSRDATLNASRMRASRLLPSRTGRYQPSID